MGTIIDLYERKVREIALFQWRCETGADIESQRPASAAEEPEGPRAA